VKNLWNISILSFSSCKRFSLGGNWRAGEQMASLHRRERNACPALVMDKAVHSQEIDYFEMGHQVAEVCCQLVSRLVICR
jgi:hypothetical protein